MSAEIFRYWVEIRDLGEDSTRKLPLKALTRIHIPTRKGEAQQPNEQILTVEDGLTTHEASSLDQLARQLREAYPDGSFERTLRCERDTAAEERHANAINELARIFAHATVRQFLRDADECDEDQSAS
jgi:hypothetical protein